MSFIKNFFSSFDEVKSKIKYDDIEKQIELIKLLKEKKGRIFFIGVGGSAANASHAVNDFRKLAGIECYCITDNVSEYSARVNDEGVESSFSNWLSVSNLNQNDCIYCLSVGGGNIEKGVSLNIVQAINYSKKVKAKIMGIEGRGNGYLSKFGDYVINIPNEDIIFTTPFTESFQSLILHAIVSHPNIKVNQTKW